MDPQNITVGCSKSCIGRLRFRLNSQYPIVILSAHVIEQCYDNLPCVGSSMGPENVKEIVLPSNSQMIPLEL